MNKRMMLALAMVAIMTSSSMVTIAGAQPLSGFSVSSPSYSPSSTSPVTGDVTNYTLYIPPQAFTQAVVLERLGSIGIKPVQYGNLWDFSVPRSSVASVNTTLHTLETKYGISYYEDINRTVAIPSLQGVSVPQSTNIPFAYTPALIARAYNFTWALSQGINGAGQTIVVIDAYGDPNLAYDIKAFDAVNGLPPINLTVQYPFGTPGQDNSTWAMETATDVEWAHALAPGARIVLLISTSAYTSDLQQLVSYAVQNKIGNIISLSWGTPENQLDLSAVNTYANVYRQAASVGIDVFAASGDNGAFSGTNQLTVDYPASDPSVTGVGGTSLYVLNNNFRQYGWGGIDNGKSYGSGGGFSTYFSTPYWQSVRGYNGTHRGVPDVAIDADKYTGVYVVSGGAQYIVGGTSVSTPMWADIAALMRQDAGVPLYSINPLVYQIARTSLYNSSFAQILSGTNGYYNNSPYWNPVTGLGTPKVSSLLNDSRKILDGYGGQVLLNGTGNYNATSVAASLNLTLFQAKLLDNGSTYYYVGFYQGPGNFARFGVLASSSAVDLMLQISQDSKTVVRHYALPAGYGSVFNNFRMQLSYTGSSIVATASGGFSQSLPAFLNYSGEMAPSVGAGQINTETNLTQINSAVFSNIQTYQANAWHNATYLYFEHYSAYNSSSYSTIDSSVTPEGLSFHYSTAQETGTIGTNHTTSPEISYTLDYGAPLLAEFFLSGTNAVATWSVNGTALPSEVFTAPVSGGYYTVNASYTNTLGQRSELSRTIYLPGTEDANVTLNYSINGYTQTPYTVFTSMWFYSFEYTGQSKMPMIRATNEINVSAYGFYDYQGTYGAPGNISLTLTPMPVNVSVFVFTGNANVTIGGKQAKSMGGYHYMDVIPTANVFVNVSAHGFNDYNNSISITPGNNVSFQITLMPDYANYSIISGSVSDYLYSFTIGGAMVRLGNSSFSYSNASGSYILFAGTGKYTANATADLYNSYSTPLNVTTNTILNIQLKPAKIALKSTALVSISHYFPLLFYFGFLSWTDYKGGNFSIYQIYVSQRSDFLNPTVTTVASQNTSYAFLTGLVPGHTYYVSVVLRLSNDQVYQSQVVKITYADPVFLGVNLVLAGAIGFYVYMAYRIFRKKK